VGTGLGTDVVGCAVWLDIVDVDAGAECDVAGAVCTVGVGTVCVGLGAEFVGPLVGADVVGIVAVGVDVGVNVVGSTRICKNTKKKVNTQ
jgi:hypothetical protein